MKFKQTNFFVCWFPLAPIFCWDIRRVFRVYSCISFSTPFAILYIITFSTFVLMAMQFKYKHRQIGWLKIWLFESMHQIGCGNAITMPNNKECQTKYIERQEKTNREFFQQMPFTCSVRSIQNSKGIISSQFNMANSSHQRSFSVLWYARQILSLAGKRIFSEIIRSHRLCNYPCSMEFRQAMTVPISKQPLFI